MPEDLLTVALAGNPNSGKTTLFNALTGSRQHVANYPGVTVEVKEGRCQRDGGELRVLDLPGTYSLTAYSPEELVARKAILEQKPDAVICVVDASNLERNLYLVTQLAELAVPLVVALNMVDEVARRGRSIDVKQLAKLLGMPVVPTVGSRGTGLEELVAATRDLVAQGGAARPFELGPEVDAALGRLEGALSGLAPELRRFYAIKLLEGDAEVGAELSDRLSEETRTLVRELQEEIGAHFGDDPEIVVADQRYGTVAGICREVVQLSPAERAELTERIDAWVTHRLLGLPILLGFMWLLFEGVFRLGASPMDWISRAFEGLASEVGSHLPAGWLSSLLVDGVIRGVGGVVNFLPQVLLLFLGLAFLEDTGYMARAVFVIDRVMHAIGLHGRSFIPLLIGFGCSVPAIMATRTLSDRRDRITTMLVVPLMSCSARLPVYALLIGAFFPPDVGGRVMLSLYALGAALAIVLAKLFRSTIFKGETAPFVMELPPYRAPTLRALVTHVWERAWLYLRRAGTIILAFSVLMWLLCNLPQPPAGSHENRLTYSVAGRLGRAIEPALRPAGLDWKMGVGLIAGLAAKEIVVSTLGTVYSLEATDRDTGALKAALARDPAFTPLVAYALMVFVLLYIPCMSTVAVVRRESNSWRWPLFLVGYTIALAWLMSTLVYQLGRLCGL